MPAPFGRRQKGGGVPPVEALLDTDVLIEVLRGRPRAVAWLASLSALTAGIRVKYLDTVSPLALAEGEGAGEGVWSLEPAVFRPPSPLPHPLRLNAGGGEGL